MKKKKFRVSSGWSRAAAITGRIETRGGVGREFHMALRVNKWQIHVLSKCYTKWKKIDIETSQTVTGIETLRKLNYIILEGLNVYNL